MTDHMMDHMTDRMTDHMTDRMTDNSHAQHENAYVIVDNHDGRCQSQRDLPEMLHPPKRWHDQPPAMSLKG